MDTATAKPAVGNEPPVSRRNWWKIAFFVALFAFELTREIAVVASAEGARPNSYARVFSTQGYTSAQGTWKRIDGGGALVPGTVTIECRQEAGQCIEASTNIVDKSVFAPDISLFNATFSPDAVTYENDLPDCAKYSVRIDLKLAKAFAVRERKQNPTNPNCAMLEPRLEMQLTDGFEPTSGIPEKHFVPLMRLIAAVF